MTSVFIEELLEGYTDSELAHHIVSSSSCASSSRVFNLSSNLIAKIYRPSEVEDALKATEVASQLEIRGPSVRKVIKNQATAYTIMDWVEGSTLDVVWKEMSWFMTIKLGLQLHRFLKILRSVTSPTAGSLATGECRSFWLEDLYGLPANSGPAEFAHFFRFWTNFMSIRRAMQASKQPQVPDSPDFIVGEPMTIKPFVLTHHDLAPRNLIVSPSGQLSLLDWDLAGFYPVTFEYASMYNFNIPEDWGLMARLRWHLLVWIGVGYHETDARLLRIMRSRFTRFLVRRRYELLEKCGPTRYPVT
ncbi:kinase-like protein [Aspergillus transmontanensis]|uniref:Kinase-like protein n=1 Tax=Aspergillus transmontanensis TaxID=1034304 RepID=A0A5N6VE87_9EURO|nr:kinase-like protein [Aspergillus transmontanensis]